MERVLAVDVGSTTTKAVLFGKRDGQWFLEGKTVAPTTVEAPDLDVMIGLRNALAKLGARTGVTLLSGNRLIVPPEGSQGVDLMVATSSAGGGLQMLVTGLVGTMTAESAHRAALGAGAVVTDILSIDDNRTLMERVEAIKAMRPDIILLTGGTDGGNAGEVAAIAEYIALAHPEPRFGQGFKIPVVFAGNVDAREFVGAALGDTNDVHFTDNIRPVLEREVLGPSRREIGRLFLEHVMMRAPGYPSLLAWSQGAVKPTPVALGDALRRVATKRGGNLLGVDIGGATTDVFSVIDGQLHRSVSANLGMSYSMGNVLSEATPESIMRWLPWEASTDFLRNWQFNKMVRPTTLPQTVSELILEQAVATEALRMALRYHKSITRGLLGVHQERDIGDVFEQTASGETLVRMMDTSIIVGSGGALSHVPRGEQAAFILQSALEPEGATELWVDDQFLLPHIGALMDVDPEAADQILFRESLVPLGLSLAPVGPPISAGTLLATVRTSLGVHEIVSGELLRVPVPPEGMDMEVRPRRDFDMGSGKGQVTRARAEAGMPWVYLDGRGRPIAFPKMPSARVSLVTKWHSGIRAYPDHEVLDEDSGEEVSHGNNR